MSQPGWAPVIYRVTGTGTPVAATLTTMEIVYNLFNAGIAATDRLQLWSGRYWADVSSMSKDLGAPSFAIKAWTTSAGSVFYGTSLAAPHNSMVSGGGTLKAIATSMTADVSFTNVDAAAFTDSSVLTYVKTTGQVGSTALVYPNETSVYRVKLDSTDKVYWSGGFMVKADLP